MIHSIVMSMVLVVSPIYATELDDSSFKLSTISQIIKENGVSETDRKHTPNTFAESLSNPGFKVEVIATGKSRELSKSIKAFLQIPSQSIQSKKEYFSNFTKEILVKENSREYWIPVQKQVFSYLEKEVKKGQKITILIRYYGSLVGAHSEFSPILMMVDFQNPSGK
jgi:hypothetical protein